MRSIQALLAVPAHEIEAADLIGQPIDVFVRSTSDAYRRAYDGRSQESAAVLALFRGKVADRLAMVQRLAESPSDARHCPFHRAASIVRHHQRLHLWAYQQYTAIATGATTATLPEPQFEAQIPPAPEAPRFDPLAWAEARAAVLCNAGSVKVRYSSSTPEIMVRPGLFTADELGVLYDYSRPIAGWIDQQWSVVRSVQVDASGHDAAMHAILRSKALTELSAAA